MSCKLFLLGKFGNKEEVILAWATAGLKGHFPLVTFNSLLHGVAHSVISSSVKFQTLTKLNKC